jgi:hypothetical protein
MKPWHFYFYLIPGFLQKIETIFVRFYTKLGCVSSLYTILHTKIPLKYFGVACCLIEKRLVADQWRRHIDLEKKKYFIGIFFK